MRKSIGLVMMAASILLLALAAWLLLRPAAPGSVAVETQSPAITPDFTRLAGPDLAVLPTQTAGPAGAPTVNRPVVVATATIKPAAPQAEVKRITPEELQRRLSESNPPLVWELRTSERYDQAHIPGSKLVKLNEITALAQNLDRKQAIVTNCD